MTISRRPSISDSSQRFNDLIQGVGNGQDSSIRPDTVEFVTVMAVLANPSMAISFLTSFIADRFRATMNLITYAGTAGVSILTIWKRFRIGSMPYVVRLQP